MGRFIDMAAPLIVAEEAKKASKRGNVTTEGAIFELAKRQDYTNFLLAEILTELKRPR